MLPFHWPTWPLIGACTHLTRNCWNKNQGLLQALEGTQQAWGHTANSWGERKRESTDLGLCLY